ncbi:MAG: DUF927 domain-containing protein [Selenomonadaceae bacterium]|nr:DUF927 domain-containing protein [Selenomonadaceae bacterium]
MEETLEALPPKPELQDKKNYATNQSVEKSISANNSNADSTTIGDKKQKRIAELVNFFNQLYGKIPVGNFVYLGTKQLGRLIFNNSFKVSDIEAMAKKAIELSDGGVDIWHSVNTVCIEPADGKRGDETVVSFQTAIVVDIDIQSDAHKGDPSLLAADFDEAKSFLPFTPSLIIHSGYGLHAYYIFDIPIQITDLNREQLKRRNNLLLDATRIKAKGKKIDGVGDLPRILRTPGTFNYKLGADNAPLCHIVEDSGLRFDPADLDQKLNALITATPTTETQSKNSRKIDIDYFDDNPDLKEFRIKRMLDYISVVDGEYEKWLSVGFALFNEGMNCSLWEQWSRSQPEFKDGECERKWNGFHHEPNGISIASLYQWAVEGGYDEKEIRNEFFQFHPELTAKKKNPVSSIDSLKAELRSVKKALADFDAEKNAAIEHLKSVETFDSDSVFADEIVTAAAFAKLFDKKTFSDFKGEITLFNRKTKEKKASVSEWSATVRDKAAEINSRQNDLLTRHNEIQAQIRSLSFVATNDDLQNFSIPAGYSVSDNGVEKVAGESMITVCRSPVIIKSKTFSVDEKIFKLTLAYMNQSGKLKALPPTEAAIVFNRNKLVDLANNGLPVTSSNANLLVDYLDAFNALNENNFPLTYTVPRCGWYHFNGTDFFIDPRKKCSIIDDDKNIKVVVDSLSLFANSLRRKGNLSEWKKIYELAKKSPIARTMVAASIAPILLKILGERNFLLYICAPTRAGKTTALYLAASAVGDEKMIRSFDATKNGLAGAAADVNDFAFLVDEKQVADSKLKEQFDTLVYALANGLGRTKLNKDSTLRKLQDWRTIAIMTGETLLLPDNVTGGANTRLLSINVTREILPADVCRRIHDTIKENHGLAFPLIIDKIFEVGFETLRQAYQDLVNLFTAKYPELLNEYCRYIAVLTLADAILNAALTDADTLPLDDSIQNANVIFKLIPTNAEISDTAREKNFVISIIAQNQNRFIGGNVPLDRMQTICGKLKDNDGYTYIAAKFLQDECERNGFDYHKLVSDLVAADFFIPADTIETGKKSTLTTVQKKIGKVNTRCYRISNDSLNDDE